MHIETRDADPWQNPAGDPDGYFDEVSYLLSPLHTLKVTGQQIRIEEPRAAFMIMADRLIQERKRVGMRPKTAEGQELTYERNSCFLQHLETLVGLWWNPNIQESHELSKHFRSLVRDQIFETIDYSDDARRKAVRFTPFGKQCLRRLKEVRRTALENVLGRLDLRSFATEAFLASICTRSREARRMEAEERLYRASLRRKRRGRKKRQS